MTGPLAHLTNHSHITSYTRTRTFHGHLHIMTGLLAHNQLLAHHPTRTRTFHIHSHIMTEPLAHFDSHITNHSHITALAHYDRTTRTSPYSHSHISYSLVHYDRTTRTFRLPHNQSLTHHRTRTI